MKNSLKKIVGLTFNKNVKKIHTFFNALKKRTIIVSKKLWNLLKKSLSRIAESTIQVHHHALKKPHLYLKSKWEWYARWHKWRWHRLVHYASLSAYLLVLGVMLFNAFKVAFAADLTNDWNFSNQSEYSLDNGVEFNGNSVRLKTRDYTNDANTSALYHMDEANGTTISDSSSNANTATTSGNPTFTAGKMNNALSLNGTNQFASAQDSASLSVTGQQSLEAWIKPDSAFNNSSSSSQTILDKGSYKLGLDRTSGKATYEIENSNSEQWTRRLGGDLAGSWSFNHASVESVVNYGSDIYVGTGNSRGDAEVWKWNGTTWTKFAGDGINNSWANDYETVTSLAVNGTALYAGLGINSGDGEVWSCEMSSGCTNWTRIGGDGVGITASTASINAMVVHGGSLYVGTGISTGWGDLYKYNGGTSWTQIGGDGLNSSWAASTYEVVASLHSDGTYLYAGIGSTDADAEVWRYDGTSWTQIGGDGLNGSWSTTYNTVRSMTSLNGKLYAGLGDGASEALIYYWDGSIWTNTNIGTSGSITQVQSLITDGTYIYASRNGSASSTTSTGTVARWDGSSWTIIAGAGINNSWSIAGSVSALLWANNRLYATPWSASELYASRFYEWVNSSWNQIGGAYINNSWGGWGIGEVRSSVNFNGKLYFGLGTRTNTAQVYEYDGTTASRVGGSSLKNSWPANMYETVDALTVYNGELYAGLGSDTNGDSDIYKYNGTTWTKVGGDGLSGSWSTPTVVNSFTVFNGKLYAGMGSGSGNAVIYSWDGSTWVQVAGAGQNGSWNLARGQRNVWAMTVFNGQLCASIAGNNTIGEVWCKGSATNWQQIAGGGLNNSWANALGLYGLAVFNGKLYAMGLTIDTTTSTVWTWDGSTWAQIGGSDLNGSWSNGTYGASRTMTVYNGSLYIGTRGSSEGNVWRYNGSSWQKIAGGSLNNSWSSGDAIGGVATLSVYKGKMYAGLGAAINANALVYSFGNNGYLETSTSSFGTSWQHLAATYDGVTMKLYIDGVLNGSSTVAATGVDNSLPLLIGRSYGTDQTGEGQSNFSGLIDEMRISSATRSSFTTKPYADTNQAVTLGTSVRKSGVASWAGLSASETANGGSLTYRLSDDEGTSWKYWNGSTWAVSTSLNNANSISVINSNISTFPISFDGIRWQAVLKGDGDQQVQLNSVTLTANSDVTAPSNASNIKMYKTNGGSQVNSNDWTNGSSPYFTWTAGTDNGAGLLGYCLYLGSSSTSDPITTKGILGNGALNNGSNCQFSIATNYIDLANSGFLSSALTSSNTPYYLNVKAIDKAGNVSASTEQFQFRFDNTPPNNPGFISAPSGFINTKSASITWPTVGGQAASDLNSGVKGLQYKINNGSWYGDNHVGTGDIGDLLENDGTYTTTSPDPPDSEDIEDGINTIYIRTWDNAGNVTTTFTTAALKVNTSGAPSEPQSVTATPAVNTVNSFAFSWSPPVTFVGNGNNLTYCYTVNTLPNANNCTFTSAGVTNVVAGSFATQPGANNFYVVARDESGNINYSSYSSARFTANTPAPGLPINTDIVDVSIKSTSNWRLAITWDEPQQVGAGISIYRIYRSTDNLNFSVIGSSSSQSFVDSGLTQRMYYYKVRACDSANNCSADSAKVQLLPTGKYTSPALITSEPQTNNITTKRAKVIWATDRNSDSKISIGTKSGEYSSSEVGNSSQVTSHTIDLDNLAAGTTYYFVAKWTDVDGNTGSSQEYTFTTSPAPVLKEVTTLSVNLSNTTLQFTVKDATKVELQYGKNDSFGGIKTLNTSRNESTYELDINGLDDGTKYFYRIVMYDSEGGKYESSIFSFTTPPRPKINNLRFQPISGEPTSTQQVTWNTNIPTNSIISYGKISTNGTLIQTQELKTTHEIIIRGLEDNSEYFLIAQGRDNNGNIAVSDKQVFKTALDTRAPLVSDIVIEPTIRGTGAEARGQIVVSWKTDEPSTSQVAFTEGSSAQVFNSKTAEDAQLTTEHLVIISDLAPSKVYSIKPISKDKSGNVSDALSQASIIGRASDSVLNIVLNTLRKVFGF